MPGASLHSIAASALPARSPQAEAAARVQTLPLYRQAERACQAHHYTRAAALLQRLSVASLSAEEARFVQSQRALCLRDAGLPVPVCRAVVPPSRAAARSRRVYARALTPETADCGPRALRLACQSLGISASLPRLRQLAGTTAAGTSLSGLATAAKALGIQAEGIQVSPDALPDVETPAIAYVNGNHFLALLSLQGSGAEGTAVIHDPNVAHEETISQERLLRLCSGYLLRLHR